MTAGSTITSPGFVSTATAAVARGVNGFAKGLVHVFASIPAMVRAYANRGPVLRMLEMDDRMLRDIGLSRGDITSALSGSALSDPSTRLRIYAVERRAGIRAQARERLDAAERLKSDEQLSLTLAPNDPSLEVK